MISISLEGKVALVTGGSRGIGRAAALMLARAGADVAVNYQRKSGAAEEVVRSVEQLGRRAVAIEADVSREDAVVHLVEETVSSARRARYSGRQCRCLETGRPRRNE